MSCSAGHIHDLIVDQLGEGEKRVLALTVAVRRVMSPARGFKGDLHASVKTALRNLIANKDVVEVDGMYALTRQGRARKDHSDETMRIASSRSTRPS